MTRWPIEDIPDPDRLYYRVHRNSLGDDGELVPSVFRERGSSMSADWEKYTTPKESLDRATSSAEDNGIIALVTGEIRNLGLRVIHDPDQARNNRAHTAIFGLNADRVKKVAIRAKLLSISSGWIIRPKSAA